MQQRINSWRWLLIGLLAWFYGGTAYLQWILPARYSGFQGGTQIVVVSPEADRILLSDAVTTPLLFLSMLPVRFLSFSFLKAAGVNEGALGHLSHTGEKYLFLADALSSIILAFGITSLVRLAARQIRLASALSEAKENLETIRRKKTEAS